MSLRQRGRGQTKRAKYLRMGRPPRVPWDSGEEEVSIGLASQGDFHANWGVLAGKYFTFHKCAN